MANLSPTATAVIAAATASVIDATAAVAVVRGNVVYINTSNQAALAQCDGTSTEATVAGIALNDAGAGQPVKVIIGGDLAMGAILTKGVIYGLSATAGAICPISDIVTSGQYVVPIGIATSTSNLNVRLWNTGVALA